jgi:4-hydroxy-4-methyl-2-oxoglutarate aldolase
MKKESKAKAASLAERLEGCYSGALYDVLRAHGHPSQVLPPAIRPLTTSMRIAGPAYPVSGRVVPDLDPHESLLQWTALLSKIPPGSIAVCQPNDSTLAHMGELSAETMKLRGVRGYIVDGGCRDSDFIEKIGFPVFCRYFTPRDVVGRWRADSFGEPVTIGGVVVSKDDFILADRDGVVVVPAAIAEEVVTRTEEVLQTENLVRKAILQGVDPQEAYLKYGKF